MVERGGWGLEQCLRGNRSKYEGRSANYVPKFQVWLVTACQLQVLYSISINKKMMSRAVHQQDAGLSRRWHMYNYKKKDPFANVVVAFCCFHNSDNSDIITSFFHLLFIILKFFVNKS
jgi:hypothetical protein